MCCRCGHADYCTVFVSWYGLISGVVNVLHNHNNYYVICTHIYSVFIFTCNHTGMVVLQIWQTSQRSNVLHSELKRERERERERERDHSFSTQHVLPLPGFLLLAPDIYDRIISFSASGVFLGCFHPHCMCPLLSFFFSCSLAPLGIIILSSSL